jgi:YaaC-like Protein
MSKEGAFARFHDSYNWNPSIYLDSCKFEWKDLITSNGLWTGQYGLTLNMTSGNTVRLFEKSSNTQHYVEHELTRQIIFVYAMSMLARYRVQTWHELIEAKKSDIIWTIQEYLTCTQSLFPNLIFNQLRGKQYYFSAAELDLMNLDTKRLDKRSTWIL